MQMPLIATLALSCAIIATGLPSAAEARQDGKITACSKYGSKCVSAKVRVTDLGPQYLSPGGNWTWCEHSCTDTLRRDTVDFWEDQRERSK